MKHLFYQLIVYLDSADEHDTNYHIALFITKHLEEVGNMGIADLARACFVSPATISRFCRSLGYDNFIHLKDTCRSTSSSTNKTGNLALMNPNVVKANPRLAGEEYIESIHESMMEINQYLDYRQVDEILHMIHQASQVAFFGTQFSQSAAMHFQTDLMMLGKFAISYLDIDRQLDCADQLDENSVAIVLTINGNYLNLASRIMNNLEQNHVPTIVITQNPNVIQSPWIKGQLVIGNPAHRKLGKYNLLYTVELLARRYYALFGSESNA